MILDKGTCSIFSAANGAQAGNKPIDQLTKKYQSWYAELDFSSDPAYVTDYREDVETSSRIRILQDRSITTRDALIFDAAPDAKYEITRAFHGTDDESGEPISDLTLRRVL